MMMMMMSETKNERCDRPARDRSLFSSVHALSEAVSCGETVQYLILVTSKLKAKENTPKVSQDSALASESSKIPGIALK